MMTSHMRIGIDATCLPSALAGAGRYILGLVNGLAALDTDHEFYIFIKSSDQPLFRSINRPNIRFVTIKSAMRPTRLFWELARSPAVIQQHDLDVWHAPHYIIPMTTNARVVVTFHDMAFFVFPELYPFLKRWMFRWAVHRASHVADHIIATSQATQDESVRLLDLDIDRITVVHHGIDTTFRPIDDNLRIAATRTRYQIPEQYILTVGTTDRRKNLDTLIRAYRLLITREDIPHTLVIAGQEGNGHRELLREVTALGISDRVHFTGYVAEEDLADLYSGARLFVTPSRYEGFGFTALEALACGTPAIVSPVPSVMETPNQADIVYKTYDTEAWYNRISVALTDITYLDRQTLRSSTWIEAARQTVEIYERAGRGKQPVTAQPSAHQSHGFSALDQEACMDAVLQTITYADLFDYPLSAGEIHKGLIGFKASANQVAAALRALELSVRIVSRDGMYMLKDRAHLSEKRSIRSACTTGIYRRHYQLLQRVCAFPFVRMVSFSGTMAHKNCSDSSDMDLFMIIDTRRMWTVYAALSIFAKILGRRDLLCMNYLIGQSDYMVEDHDFYTAHQIAALRPIFGWDQFRRFTSANTWVMDHLPQWTGHSSDVDCFAPITLPGPMRRLKQILELLLIIPVFTPIEWLVRRLYGNRIARISRARAACDIRLDRDCIKLHTNDHSRRIMDRFEQRLSIVTENPDQIPLDVMKGSEIH